MFSCTYQNFARCRKSLDGLIMAIWGAIAALFPGQVDASIFGESARNFLQEGQLLTLHCTEEGEPVRGALPSLAAPFTVRMLLFSGWLTP
jgi:hypothetical protein